MMRRRPKTPLVAVLGRTNRVPASPVLGPKSWDKGLTPPEAAQRKPQRKKLPGLGRHDGYDFASLGRMNATTRLDQNASPICGEKRGHESL